MERPWLYVGAKVVCVNNVARLSRGCRPMRPAAILTVDAVYTVTEVFCDPARDNFVHVRLAEIQNIGMTNGIDGLNLGYRADRFRPVLPDTTETVAKLRTSMRDAVKRGEPVSV